MNDNHNRLLLVSIRVIEFLERLPRKQRTILRNAISAIENNPLLASDRTDYDSEGRYVHIKIVHDYALVYWVDDADRHLKILDIHAIDW